MGARLAQARDLRFVGRATEQELFRRTLTTDPMPMAVLWVVGPGGIGKTALLGRFASLARNASVHPVVLDAQRIDPSAGSFTTHLADALGIPQDADPVVAMHDGRRRVLLIDAVEQLDELETWLREDLLPALPADCLVVITSRKRPAAAWVTDGGWAELLKTIALRNLAPDESRAFLTRSKVDDDHHGRVLAQTHGHPLALALVAEVLAQAGEPLGTDVLQAPNVISALLERFTAGVSDDEHRLALYAAAHARVTDEALLQLIAPPERASALFDWLCSLSFAEWGVDGLHLHDLAAEALDRDYRLRNPRGYADLHRRIRAHVLEDIRSATGLAQYRLARELCWMHRFSPLMGPFIDWPGSRALHPTPPEPGDADAIVAAVERHEGKAAARIAAFWLARSPEAFLVIRGASGGAVGFVSSLHSGSSDRDVIEADARLAALHAYARSTAPLRKGETLCLNWWLDFADGASPGAVFAHAAIQSIRAWFGSTRTAFTFECIPAKSTDTWTDMMAYIDHRPGPEVTVGDRVYHLYGHDWRQTPVMAFMETMLEREISGQVSEGAPSAQPLLVLSYDEFAESVRQALRDFTRPDALANNPLSRCRVVRELPPDGEPADARDVSLQRALTLAAETLTLAGKDEKLYAALKLTYLDPAPSQETAADLLNVPFSSFRRHLGRAIERVVEWLWLRELEGY